MKRRKVGILLFDYVDVLDFSGPAEVLALAANNNAEQMLTLYKKELMPTRPFEVFTVSKMGEEIITHSKIKVKPDYSFETCPETDILIIPGGPLRAVQSIAKNERIIDWISSRKRNDYICSVCTGAIILSETGLLNGRKATTHHLALTLLQNKYPEIQVIPNKKVVHDGNIITSGGVSSGIHMALYLIEQIMGKSAAERTRKVIEFHP
ncbi:AraC family transcriptional regulator [Compostibacillus humi]|jgi:transcriptional regulator GlxA family with amidase domain|uniref:AraC family transcriptional regulator n=1 Tax=Compostibacillus humi TaxID=1245525 RepID=A0A8J2TNX6_9BACI|nr:DJ-1/PfpI family protein [Compostibacillus humi]GFZ84805.1 AraC family transcriptional regulator [Compostibacillus humi]HLT54503.1 DJ-1/PfpI family protein [Bacillota bacterium]